MKYPEGVSRETQTRLILDRVRQLPLVPGNTVERGRGADTFLALLRAGVQPDRARRRAVVATAGAQRAAGRRGRATIGARLLVLTTVLNMIVAAVLAVLISVNAVHRQPSRNDSVPGASQGPPQIVDGGGPRNDPGPAEQIPVGHDETVLAVFALSAPDGIEEEVAQAHRLDIVGRAAMSTLGWRVARYRVPAGQSPAAVIDNLRADPRVSHVLVGDDDRLPDPDPPTRDISSRQEPPQAQDGASEKGQASAGPAERGGRRKAANRTTVGARTAGMEQRAPERADGAGDVLAGGL